MGTDKLQHAAPAADVVQNPDDWRAGLRFGLKTLNVKSVRRAKVLGDVLLVCLRHNLRQRNDDHRHKRPIDPMLARNNSVLLGAADSEVAAAAARAVFEQLKIDPPRRDSIVGVELVFQPPEGHDNAQFYDACLRWANERYEHLLSAVVHRDQRRPHMHLLVLALKDGKLDGAALTSGPRRLEAQRADLMACLRRELHIRPDREIPPQRRSTAIFVSKGKGAQTRAGAAKSDAALMARAGQQLRSAAVAKQHWLLTDAPGEPDLLAQGPHGPGDLMPSTSYCARCARVNDLLIAWAGELTCLAGSLRAGCGVPDLWSFAPLRGAAMGKHAVNDDHWAA